MENITEHRISLNVSQLKNRSSSYGHFSVLCYELSKLHNTQVTIDFSQVTFISGNFFSIIGDIFNTYHAKNNIQINVSRLRVEIADVMRKNGFGRYFGIEEKEDSYGTVIPYQQYHSNDIDIFKQHITAYVFQHKNMPSMSEALKSKIINNVLEIFINVRDHSAGSMIHSCGQYFPKNRMLRFTLSDIGTTISENVVQYHKEKGITFAGNALKWALIRGNSTRSDEPGGLGFSLIMEFIKLNHGEFSVISGNQGYEYVKGKEMYFDLPALFQGTIVTMSFNLADPHFYCLKSETKKKVVF